MAQKVHELKILPEYYDAVIEGKKHFELRKDDRKFDVGDMVILREWNGSEYTNRARIFCEITYILRNCPEYGLMDGYCILGF